MMRLYFPAASRFFRFPRGSALLSGAILSLVFLACGCGKPPNLVYKYILEYPSPTAPASHKIEAVLKVEPFAVAQAFNSTAMIYQPNPYKSESYTYHRWRVNPGQMVTDYLLRDLRNAGIFQAVLPEGSSGKSRFLLEGGVEEMEEIDAPAGWNAALALTVTLLDLNRQEISQRVVFQKNYRVLEPITDKTPAGLAQSMSRAMEKLSAQIIGDVYRAAQAK